MTATNLKVFDIAIPAGTLPSAPLVTPATFEDNEVQAIEWHFPDGCNGVVGIQIGARGIPVLPSDRTKFFIRSGATQGYDLSDLHTTGDWSVIGYNTGGFPHTVHVVFKVARMEPGPPIPGYLLSDVVDTLMGGG